MYNLIYENPAKVIFGRGARAEFLPSLLSGYGEEVLIISRGESGLPYPAFIQRDRYATISEVRECAHLVREEGYEFLLGIGDSSTSELAKAVSLYASGGDEFFMSFFSRPLVIDFPLIPVGLVAGTLECSSFLSPSLLVTFDDGTVERGRENKVFAPRFVLVEPDVSCSGATCLFSLLLLSYLSSPAERVPDELLLSLVRVVKEELEKPSSSSDLLWCSLLSGSPLFSASARADAVQYALDTGCSYEEAVEELLRRRILSGGRKCTCLASSVFSVRRRELQAAVDSIKSKVDTRFQSYSSSTSISSLPSEHR